MSEFKQLLKEIRWLRADLAGKDCLLTEEQSLDEIKQLVYTAEALDYLHRNNTAARCFESGLALSVLEDKSVSTRLAFALAANLLGLTVQELDAPLDTLLSSFAEVIGIRNESRGSGHNSLKEAAARLDEFYKEESAGLRPGIVNLGSDLDHPTYTLTALLHLKRHFGSFENLENKRVALTLKDAPASSQTPAILPGLAALLLRFGMQEPVLEAAGAMQTDAEQPALDIACESGRVSRSQPFVIAAVILNNRFPDPAQILENLHKKNEKRAG